MHAPPSRLRSPRSSASTHSKRSTGLRSFIAESFIVAEFTLDRAIDDALDLQFGLHLALCLAKAEHRWIPYLNLPSPEIRGDCLGNGVSDAAVAKFHVGTTHQAKC